MEKIGTAGYRKRRSIIGKPKNLTVSRRGNKWFVHTQTEYKIERQSTVNSEVGINMGVMRFVTFSDGPFVESISSLKII